MIWICLFVVHSLHILSYSDLYPAKYKYIYYKYIYYKLHLPR